jgi:hypothetical protein
MKLKTLKFFLLLAFTISLSACSKDNSNKSKTDLLTLGTWKFASAGLDSDKNGTVDMQDGTLEACDKDNIATFNINGDGAYDEGSVKCERSDPQTKPFVWQFKNAEKEIEFAGETFTVLSISETQLRVYFDRDLGGGNIVRYLLVLTH